MNKYLDKFPKYNAVLSQFDRKKQSKLRRIYGWRRVF